MVNLVKVTCKKCGTLVPADQFRLHYEYKMMVCPSCYTGKNKVKEDAVKNVPAEPPKPAGWDKEDEYLEKASKQRKEETTNVFSRLPGTDLVKCRCPKCKYVFKYDPVRKSPSTCPYCNGEIPRFKTYSLS
jgi:Zn finger protein HypA/HybF involved in hydrogenase expression